MAFLLSFVLFLAGIYVFGLAFTLTAWNAIVFFCGILLIAIAVAIPAHILARR